MKSRVGANIGALGLIDWAKLIGFLLVVVATIISTVVIPSKDEELSKLDKEILDFKDSRVLGGISMLHYGGQRIFRRIELFEANQLVPAKEHKESVAELRSRALEQTVRMAGEWATLFGGDEAKETKEESEERVRKIITDDTLTFGDKLSQVEAVWVDNIDKASQRLKAAHEEYRKHKTKKQHIEGTRLLWAGAFAWLQILGLILFSGAEVFGKLIQSKASGQ